MKALLESYYLDFNQSFCESSHADPLIFVKQNIDFKYLVELAFISSMLSYGNAKMILKTLRSIDFSLLDARELKKEQFPLYRFQTSQDICNLFRLTQEILHLGGLKKIFLSFYKESKKQKQEKILDALHCLQDFLNALILKLGFQSKGLSFLVGKAKSNSALKRMNMFLRWMVRKDKLDLGLFEDIDKSHLILPLDTHTFSISKKLGLLKKGSYNIKSALSITNTLLSFDSLDPIKYDFALYRLGQLKLI